MNRKSPSLGRQAATDRPTCDTAVRNKPRTQSVHFSPDQPDSPLLLRRDQTRTQLSSTSSIVDKEWVPQMVLSLDGGGIRGYSSLLILQQLMLICKELEVAKDPSVTSSFHPEEYRPCENNEVPKATAVKDPEQACRFIPCHYFDYIGGTSTGGLIAIMLGRLRMGIDEAIAEYETLADEIFGHPRTFSYRGPLPAFRNKYSGKKMLRTLENVVTRRSSKQQLEVGGGNFESPPRLCRTVCVAYKGKPLNNEVNVDGPYLFRSYDHLPMHPPDALERNPGKSHSIPIAKVARATSAAPTYFDNIAIQDRIFGDGGFGTNNPAYELMLEVGQMNNTNLEAIQMFLSIGTGESRVSRFSEGTFGELYTYVKAAKKLATSSDVVHGFMQSQRQNYRLPYFRFNVPVPRGHPVGNRFSRESELEILGEMKMDDWKKSGLFRPKSKTTLERIKRATAAYLMDEDVIKELKEVANVLVERRIARSETSLWNMVSTGVRYRCTVPKCSKGHKFRECRENLIKHLKSRHIEESYGDETDEERAILEKRVEAGELPY